ncbi:MAG: HipA domain-containing protein [Lacunisphaera sp.]|nr:HipA domain-containing protein [Lacunisphaera sp.]
MESVKGQFYRMTSSIIARHQDDHLKNIAFLMGKTGCWFLPPDFDVNYRCNPSGAWTDRHQMTLNGKRDGFTQADFLACAKNVMMKRGRADTILEEVRSAVTRWPNHAEQAHVTESWRRQIQESLRLSLPKGSSGKITHPRNPWRVLICTLAGLQSAG